MAGMAALACHKTVELPLGSIRVMPQAPPLLNPLKPLHYPNSFLGSARLCIAPHADLNLPGLLKFVAGRVRREYTQGIQILGMTGKGGLDIAKTGLNDGLWNGLGQTVVDSVAEALLSVRKPALVALLFCLLVTQSPELAVAASGGRVGGSSFPKGAQTRSAPSRPSPSRSYSRPSSPIISAPSPINTFEREYITTIPLTAPAPTHYMGPATSFGVGSSSVFFLVFFMGCAAVQAVNGFITERSMGGSLLAGTQTSSVLKLQVGLLGLARTLQRDLDHIAENADTTTTKGLHYILTEACLAMLRHPDFCLSALSSSHVKRSMNDVEEQFNQLSLEERGKFDEETFVNVNSIRKRMMAASRGTRFSNEFIVVTVLVAVEGEHKLPTINSSADLNDALQKLGSLPADSIQAVEVLWTPQDENDTLTERELLRKYPLLRSL